jgi:general stress protein CsbA
MQLSQPKQITFWIAVILVVIGIIVSAFLPNGEVYDFWFVLVGFLVLAAGNLVKGL